LHESIFIVMDWQNLDRQNLTFSLLGVSALLGWGVYRLVLWFSHVPPALTSPKDSEESSPSPSGDDTAQSEGIDDAKKSPSKSSKGDPAEPVVLTGDSDADQAKVAALIETLKADVEEELRLATGKLEPYELKEDTSDQGEKGFVVVVAKKRKEGQFPVVAVTGVIEASLEEVDEIFSAIDFKTIKALDAGCVGVQEVLAWPELGVNILHKRQGKYLGGLVGARDYVILYSKNMQGETITKEAISVQHALVAVPPGSTRGRILIQAIRMTPTGDGSTCVTFLKSVDIGMKPSMYGHSLPGEYKKIIRQVRKLAKERAKSK